MFAANLSESAWYEVATFETVNLIIIDIFKKITSINLQHGFVPCLCKAQFDKHALLAALLMLIANGMHCVVLN